MVVEPLPGKYQESLAVRAVRDLIAQDPHKSAAIFSVADYGLEADLFTAVPELVKDL